MRNAMPFVKLHGVILRSSIWTEPLHVRIVWITMLTLADANGVVEASVGGLAIQAQVTREQCEEALAILEGPDPDSRDGTTGERIERVPGGWFVLNYQNYRDRQTTQQAATAERVRRHRARRKAGVTGNASNARNALSPLEAEAEGEGEADQKKNPQTPAAAGAGSRGRRKSVHVERPAAVPEDLWREWAAVRRAAITENALKGLLREAAKAGFSVEQAVRECVERGWRGFRADWVRGGKRRGADMDRGTFLDPNHKSTTKSGRL